MIHLAEEVAAFLFLALVTVCILVAFVAAVAEGFRQDRERLEGLAIEWARRLPASEAQKWLPVAKAHGLVEAWRQAQKQEQRR